MPHTLIKPTVIARRGLAVLYNQAVLAGLVSRDFDADFAGKVGDTINVRTPTTFVAKVFDRNNGIELQDAIETSFPLELDTLLDVSFPVTAEDLSLNIVDFQEQFLVPAMEALIQDIDGRIAEGLVDAASAVADGSTTPSDAYRDARAKLSRAKMPLTERYAVLSPEAVSDVTTDDLLVKANESGSTDALRDANIGRVFGIENYESQVFGHGSGDKGQADGVAFHRSAYVLASRTLDAPLEENADSAVESYRGFGLRVVKDYDITYKQDVVSVDTLIGVAAVPSRTGGIVELNFGQGS